MKCEKCGNNETSYHYSASINGVNTERHLCSDCAVEEGLHNALNWRPSQRDDTRISDLNRDKIRSILSSFVQMMPTNFVVPAHTMPVFRNPDMRESAIGPEAVLSIPEDISEELKPRREIIALRQEMSEAIIGEDYEKAADLRDRIRALEMSAENK